MIRCEIDEVKGKSTMEIEGSPFIITSEMIRLVNAFYYSLNAQDKALATMFRNLFTKSVQEPQSPMWDVTTPDGSIVYSAVTSLAKDNSQGGATE